MIRRISRDRSFLVGALAFLAFFVVAAAIAAGSGKPAGRSWDGNWPRKIRLGEAILLIDAPEADSLEGAKLKAHGGLQMKRSEADAEASPGRAWYEADVTVDRDQRVVHVTSVEAVRVQLDGVPAARQQRIATRLGQAMTHFQLRLPLDDVLAAIRIGKGHGDESPKLNTDPPRIVFESQPAILVLFDGEPRFRAVEGSKLERALNTPFLVLREPNGGAYYLDGGTSWFRASDPSGPWSKADKVPSEAVQIANRDLQDAGVSATEVKEAKEAVESADKRVPKILVATEPTELIVSDGAPRWAPAVEGELEAMSNSESDVFRTVADKQYFLVLSGRWYRSGSLDGPWNFVEPSSLPGSFRKIRSDSAKADVLSFVPGTGPAREALADENKPRTAAIRRSEAHANVTYDGDPKFEAVAGTRVEYGLNTSSQVLRIGGRYYVCDQGVWFSANAPTGPWQVADKIPEDEIQAIPPESPVYNTRFVYVYDATPSLVYTAYTPAYLGSYPYGGTVVFGTGWAYRPWWGAYYYPRPLTWGFHARYALWAGWGYGFAWGPAWGGFRYGFGYGWGARWCGPGGFYRPAFRNVNLARREGFARGFNAGRNLYSSGANANRAVVNRGSASNQASGQMSKSAKTSQGAKRANGAKGSNGAKGQARKGKPGGARGGGGGKGKKH